MEKKQYIDIQLIKDLMDKRHYDNNKMAELMKVTPAMLKQLLDGADQKHIGGDILVKAAQALGIPAHLLIHKDYC